MGVVAEDACILRLLWTRRGVALVFKASLCKVVMCGRHAFSSP